MDIDAGRLYAYGCILTMATTSIIAGAFSALRPPKSIKSAIRASAENDEEDEEEEELETISKSDAYMFPIIGSCVLGGFYVVLKYIGPEWINWVLGWYFALMGFGAVWKSLDSLTRLIMGHTAWQKLRRFKLLLLGSPTKQDSGTKATSDPEVSDQKPEEIFVLPFRIPSLLLAIPAAVPSILYSSSINKHWILTNILGLSFAHNAIGLLRLDGFFTGIVLLSGLFFYDIWWVFGTEVMVTVAKGLDLPIKILWPKAFVLDASPRNLTMLGLGDIVIPGVFVALALRYDLSKAPKPPFPPYTPTSAFPKPYFHATLTSYVLGLATTIAVMEVFQSAQPALLYLSPACIVAFMLTSLARGELKEALAWREESADRTVSDKQQSEPSQAGSDTGTVGDDGKATSDYAWVKSQTQWDMDDASGKSESDDGAGVVVTRASET